jgi:predicted ribonuclease toxin of YeeF-YezG toxin-antitoxin module
LSYYADFNYRILEERLNKPNGFNFDLNEYINCYDEIKELVEKIYYEGPIPGKYELEEWKDNELFEKYTGYIEGRNWRNKTGRGNDWYTDDWKIKTYVEYAEKDYDFYRNNFFYNKFLTPP